MLSQTLYYPPYGSVAYDSEDYIIALSVDDLVDYFEDNNEARRGINTQYAIRQGAYNSSHGSSSWWLAEHGNQGQMCVRSSGEISFSGYSLGNVDFGARPAMWIAID